VGAVLKRQVCMSLKLAPAGVQHLFTKVVPRIALQKAAGTYGPRPGASQNMRSCTARPSCGWERPRRKRVPCPTAGGLKQTDGSPVTWVVRHSVPFAVGSGRRCAPSGAGALPLQTLRFTPPPQIRPCLRAHARSTIAHQTPGTAHLSTVHRTAREPLPSRTGLARAGNHSRAA